MGRPLRVVSWNVKVNRSTDAVLDGLEELIDNNSPDVIALQEAGGYMGALRDRLADRWHVYAHNEWPESNMCPIMVSRDFKGKKRGQGWSTLRTHKGWTGPQGGHHEGRTWTWSLVNGLHVMSLHRVTAGTSTNGAAFHEEHDALVQWIRNHRPCLVIGDHNIGPKHEDPDGSRAIAQDSGGKLAHPGGGIDYAIQHGASGGVSVKGAHGSDHEAILWKRT